MLLLLIFYRFWFQLLMLTLWWSLIPTGNSWFPLPITIHLLIQTPFHHTGVNTPQKPLFMTFKDQRILLHFGVCIFENIFNHLFTGFGCVVRFFVEGNYLKVSIIVVNSRDFHQTIRTITPFHQRSSILGQGSKLQVFQVETCRSGRINFVL